jgi:hypothetical protein
MRTLAAADLLRTLPGSEPRVVGLPIMSDGERPHPRSDSPKLGAHNEEVFAGRRAAAAKLHDFRQTAVRGCNSCTCILLPDAGEVRAPSFAPPALFQSGI